MEVDKVQDCCMALVDAQRIEEKHGHPDPPSWDLLMRARSFLTSYNSSRRRTKWREDVHSSHDMTDWYTDIRSPVGTARFYSVRHCKKCEAEMSEHPAGQFKDSELTEPCE